MELRKESIFNQLRQEIFVIYQLVRRDKQRNISATFLGELWKIINPLINMIVMVLVFGQMLGNKNDEMFPLYVLTGTIILELFNVGTTDCLYALSGNKNFLIKSQVDKSVYVKQKIVGAVQNFLYSLIIYAFVIALYELELSMVILVIIPDIILLIFIMLGVGKILAIINVSFADITYFYEIFTLMLMYGSAIFYRVDRMSPLMQKIMLINPIYISVTIAREAVMDGKIADSSMWIAMVVIATISYFLGTYLFNREIENIVAKL